MERNGYDAWTPLHEAVSRHDLPATTALLEHGGEINVNSVARLTEWDWEQTPLTVAIRGGNHDIARLLLRHGADTARPPGNLLRAVLRSDVIMLGMLTAEHRGTEWIRDRRDWLDLGAELTLFEWAFMLAVAIEQEIVLHGSDRVPMTFPLGHSFNLLRVYAINAEHEPKCSLITRHRATMDIVTFLARSFPLIPPNTDILLRALNRHAFMTLTATYKIFLDLKMRLEWPERSVKLNNQPVWPEQLRPAHRHYFPSVMLILARMIARTSSQSPPKSETRVLQVLFRLVEGKYSRRNYIPTLTDLAVAAVRDVRMEERDAVILPPRAQDLMALSDLQRLFDLLRF